MRTPVIQYILDRLRAFETGVGPDVPVGTMTLSVRLEGETDGMALVKNPAYIAWCIRHEKDVLGKDDDEINRAKAMLDYRSWRGLPVYRGGAFNRDVDEATEPHRAVCHPR